MICFLRALCTVLYFLKALVASYQGCVFALICASVLPPSISSGACPGKGGFAQAASGELPSGNIRDDDAKMPKSPP
jgi:hypothetical protein